MTDKIKPIEQKRQDKIPNGSLLKAANEWKDGDKYFMVRFSEGRYIISNENMVTGDLYEVQKIINIQVMRSIAESVATEIVDAKDKLAFDNMQAMRRMDINKNAINSKVKRI